MTARQSWYNEERVRQSGSVILSEWKRINGPEALRSLAAVTPAPARRRAYAGAVMNRLNAEWNPMNTSGDSELLTSLRILRARSRQLVRDNEHAKNAVRIVANNVIGSGIGVQARVETAGGKLVERINSQIEAAHAAWSQADSCHTGGKLALADLETLAVKCLARDGEVLIRKVKKPFGSTNKIPFALELIEGDRLMDTWQTAQAPNGNTIRMGVEVDEWGRPQAYWLHPMHPGDYSFRTFVPAKFIRVPAEEMIHLYIVDRWPQTRGEPWFHATIKRLHNMGGYEEAEIVAARASASIMGIINSPELPVDDGVEDGERLTDLSPGTVHHLMPGETFTGFAPNRPNAAIDPFMRHMLRAVAAGIGCSYESLSRDYSQSNYSSSRLSQLDDRDLWRILQGFVIRNLRQPIYREWLDAAVMSGAINIPDFHFNRAKYEKVRFKPRGWNWIDPTKEVAAFKAAVRCGFMTVGDVIAQTANGADPEDIFKARREELDLMADLDLVFDTDVAQTDDKGKGQAVTPAAEEEGAAASPSNEPDGDESAAEPDSDDQNAPGEKA